MSRQTPGAGPGAAVVPRRDGYRTDTPGHCRSRVQPPQRGARRGHGGEGRQRQDRPGGRPGLHSGQL